MAGPPFYGGPDLQRAGFWRARGRIQAPHKTEGLPRRLEISRQRSLFQVVASLAINPKFISINPIMLDLYIAYRTLDRVGTFEKSP